MHFQVWLANLIFFVLDPKYYQDIISDKLFYIYFQFVNFFIVTFNSYCTICTSYLEAEPQLFDSMPWRQSCRELMRTLQRSSADTLDCLIRLIAVTKVSIALPQSAEENTRLHQALIFFPCLSKILAHTSKQCLHSMFPIFLCFTCTGVRHRSRYGAGRDGSVPVHDLLKLRFAQRGP